MPLGAVHTINHRSVLLRESWRTASLKTRDTAYGSRRSPGRRLGRIPFSNSHNGFDIVIASEAKQSSFGAEKQKAGLLRRSAPRNDGERRVRLLAARCARVLHEAFAPN